jgi:hypothetical protein
MASGRYFVDLNAGPWQHEAYDQIHTHLLEAGWTKLQFPQQMGPDDVLWWWDENHPGPEAVVAMVSNLLDQAQVQKGQSVYIVGDSTTAYSVDRKGIITWTDLKDRIFEKTGVWVFFAAVSGSSFDERWGNIVQQAADMDSRWYNHILLVGGWNQETCDGLAARLVEFEQKTRL